MTDSEEHRPLLSATALEGRWVGKQGEVSGSLGVGGGEEPVPPSQPLVPARAAVSEARAVAPSTTGLGCSAPTRGYCVSVLPSDTRKWGEVTPAQCWVNQW